MMFIASKSSQRHIHKTVRVNLKQNSVLKMNKTFRILKKVILYTFSILLLLSVAGYTYLYVLPKGPEITEIKKINSGIDSFVIYAYKDSERKSIKVWTYKPESWNDKDKIVFVMHGGGRNADDYLKAWIELADENINLLIIAPEFENKFSKYTTNDYQEEIYLPFLELKTRKVNGHIQLLKTYLTTLNRLTTLQTNNTIFSDILLADNLCIEW